WELCLDASVEEEGHMSIFFGFGDSQVAEAVLSHDVSEDHVVMLGFECNRQIEVAIVPGHAGEPDVELFAAFESVEILTVESHGRLASPVCSKVEEDYAIMVSDRGDRYARGINDGDWFHEFIGYAFGVILLYCGNRFGSRTALAGD